MTLYPLGDTSARAEISMLTVLESCYNAIGRLSTGVCKIAGRVWSKYL